MVSRYALAGACALVFGSGVALGQFDTATTVAEVLAQAALNPNTDQESVTGPAYPFFVDSAGANVEDLDNEAFASASARLDVQFPASNVVAANGSAGADIDDQNQDYAGTGSFAYAYSTASIAFEISEESSWALVSAFLGGTHADASVDLFTSGGELVFQFQNEDASGATGTIPAGGYVFTVTTSAFSSVDDGFGGLSAGASFFVEFRVDPVPAPAAGAVLGMGMIVALRRRR